MKNMLLVAMIVGAASACFGQAAASSISSQPQPIQIPSHPMQAEQHSMATEHWLVGGGPSTYTYAQGERPLWEFGTLSQPVPLGDIARAVRKEKQTAKKAEFVFEKQGS